MSTGFQPTLDFEAANEAAEDGAALVIDIDGYEGPLHVLLALARSQKVDLLQLSITKLAEQYLAFVQQARRVRFSLAADYLVMAAWLAFRLAKLDVMRKAVEALKDRPILKRDVFMRGDPEAVKIVSSTRFEGDLYALMTAYITQRKREHGRHYAPRPPQAYPLEDARDRLRDLLPEMKDWTTLSGVAPVDRWEDDPEGPSPASYLASTLAASLELVKEGILEARQMEAFSDVYLRTRAEPLEATA